MNYIKINVLGLGKPIQPCMHVAAQIHVYMHTAAACH